MKNENAYSGWTLWKVKHILGTKKTVESISSDSIIEDVFLCIIYVLQPTNCIGVTENRVICEHNTLRQQSKNS